MAQNLVDGLTPAVVSRFRKQVLAQRTLGPTLVDELTRRLHTLPARVLPGLGAPSNSSEAVIFVIGPEKQFASWEQYLASIHGATTTVFRLYPRDFWIQTDAK